MPGNATVFPKNRKILVAKSKYHGNTLSHSCRASKAGRKGGTDPPDKKYPFLFLFVFLIKSSLNRNMQRILQKSAEVDVL